MFLFYKKITFHFNPPSMLSLYQKIAKMAIFYLILNNEQHPIWLAWQYSFRTFDWSKALPVPELALGQIRQLLAII